ncbi:glycosyltransferase family 4 protein [Methylobacterium sp. J-068]|uniref:glycosyltransferase family 4 protein n=1 Tax=Methylobacterium sp. J-068 TaxID=2836649 RepID=UPI002444D559|nr:glycosyltransferase family 4 protein [Methylobacterium sp. J-068]
MRRVLFICPTRVAFGIDTPASVGLGGIESTNLALTRALARRGFAVVLATRRTGSLERDGVLNIPLAEIARHAADAVVSSNDPRPLRGFPDAKRIAWVHNPINLEKALRKRYLLPILSLRPDAVFVGSIAAATMSPVFAYRRRHVVPHGIAPAFREPEPTRGLGRDFVYASQPQRGLERMLALWRTAPAVIASGARLHVFGSDYPPSGDETGPIVFHPRVGAAALAAFYARARAMVCPGSVDETFCLAAAEAQAMGLPVITSGIGALSERVQHGVNGLIAPGDRDFAEAVVGVAGNDTLWSALSAGALLQREALTWERAAILWEAILREAATGPSAARR